MNNHTVCWDLAEEFNANFHLNLFCIIFYAGEALRYVLYIYELRGLRLCTVFSVCHFETGFEKNFLESKTNSAFFRSISALRADPSSNSRAFRCYEQLEIDFERKFQFLSAKKWIKFQFVWGLILFDCVCESIHSQKCDSTSLRKIIFPRIFTARCRIVYARDHNNLAILTAISWSNSAHSMPFDR